MPPPKSSSPAPTGEKHATGGQCLYVVEAVPGRGQGLVAATNIAAGTRILADTPLVTLPKATHEKDKACRAISSQLAARSEQQRRAYFSLYNAYEHHDGRELGIARTNALPLGANAVKVAVFLVASRINHACDNNAQNTWNAKTQRLTIHATREIPQGEEITIYYLDRYSNRALRHLSLATLFRFTCSCRLCSLEQGRRIISDQRLDEIQALYDRTGHAGRIDTKPLRALHDVRKLLALLKEEGIVGASESSAYYDAFQIAVAHGDAARAAEFARRASSSRVLAEGHDSPEAQRLAELAADPSKHHSYAAFSTKWMSSAEGAPQGLGPDSFDGWLWRAHTGTAPPPPADLRSAASFPPFNRLPSDADLSDEYFCSPDGFCYGPRKNWCFLGEIVRIEALFRLRLALRDRLGRTMLLAFHTEGRGTELPPSQVCIGHTVAVLYAQRHLFLDGSVGIRHEYPKFLRIFPLPLGDLLALSDRVKRHAVVDKRAAACHTCGARSHALLRCARCALFWYCDKACQTAGWRQGGHSADCKLLRDPDLRGLFRLEWGTFMGHHEFA